MKAMCIDENRNFIWRDVPDPVCHGEFDVNLRVKACALNRADLMQRAMASGLLGDFGGEPVDSTYGAVASGANALK